MTELLGEFGRRRVVRSVIDGWTGAAPTGKVLAEHASASQHHITVTASSGAATGTLRIRMVPTGLGRPVALSDELEAIVLLDVGRSATFVVNGFYEEIRAQFTTPLSAGTVTITVASVGEHLSALPVPGAREHGRKVPPTSVITSGWAGTSSAGKVTPGHVGMALHHFALACVNVPVSGSVRVQGKPVESSVFVNLTDQLSLTATGTLNLFFEGFYEEFRIVPSAISGAGGIVARVASSGEDLNTHVNVDRRLGEIEVDVEDINTDISNLEQDIQDVADDLADHEAAVDPHPQYTTTAEAQAIADAKVADAINDGTTTVAPSQNAVFDALALKMDKTHRTSFRNYIINGDFLIAQRGTSFAAATGARYMADRWVSIGVGSTVAPSLQAFAVGQTDVPGNPLAFHRCVVVAGAGASDLAVLQQHIEYVGKTAGMQATYSFYAKASSALNMSVEMAQNFGSGGSSQVSVIGVQKFSLTTSWQKFTFTFDIPSISGKTIGSNSNSLEFNFWLDAGSSHNARNDSLGHQSGTFDISLVQLERGDTASDFEFLDWTTQLDICKRYYENNFGNGEAVTPITSVPIDQVGVCFASNSVRCPVMFEVEKRKNDPTMTLYSPGGIAATNNGNWATYLGGSWGQATVTSVSLRNTKGFLVDMTRTATVGDCYIVLGQWAADAEF